MLQLQPGIFLEKLGPAHYGQIQEFDCGHVETNEFLHESAAIYAEENLGKTYLISNGEGTIFGFITLTMGVLKMKDADLALNLGDLDKPGQLPALRIARLGTSASKQGKGYGSLALEAAANIFRLLQGEVGTRYIVLDAVPERVAWYAKRGFKSVFSDLAGRTTIPMYFRPPK
ncbi:GNAT family N-acetyltransferase [Candidatus Micrarchaeota archaeon]|nr:GNAT family N-acetyltransferase [Candidatus Micrarchaeota archaeon]